MEILSVRILWDDGVYHRSEGYAEKERKNAEDHYMNFFKRKQVKKPKERNEITNKELKEDIANIALHILQKDTDYENLAYTKVEFGYLFDIEGHGREALFKIITDKTTVYFAVQGTEMLRLNFSEELYQTTVDGFLDLHS